MRELEVLEQLLQAGADPDCSDGDGMTALMIAVKNDMKECTKLLLKYDAGVNLRNHQNQTPLMIAIIYGR